MNELPPLLRDQRKVDAEHLKLLGVFHYVLGGLSVVGLGFLCMHWAFMHAIMGDPATWQNSKGGPPPPQMLAVFQWFYLFFGTVIVLHGVMNTLSGWLIFRRRGRMFSLIVAGLDCLMFPFGTALGVFTFIVLLRDSVQEVYGAADTNRGPGA
ncbi:MAG: hypothetical protein HYV95_16945 [Opitutae bacterium]|nr:hypothetical protein [Opitutae bacterium]